MRRVLTLAFVLALVLLSACGPSDAEHPCLAACLHAEACGAPLDVQACVEGCQRIPGEDLECWRWLIREQSCSLRLCGG